MDFAKELTDKFQDMGQLRRPNRSDVLSALNLQEKQSTTDYLLPALGIFGVGMLIGAALGVIVAPKSGKATRREIAKKVDEAVDTVRG